MTVRVLCDGVPPAAFCSPMYSAFHKVSCVAVDKGEGVILKSKSLGAGHYPRRLSPATLTGYRACSATTLEKPRFPIRFPTPCAVSGRSTSSPTVSASFWPLAVPLHSVGTRVRSPWPSLCSWASSPAPCRKPTTTGRDGSGHCWSPWSALPSHRFRSSYCSPGPGSSPRGSRSPPSP